MNYSFRKDKKIEYSNLIKKIGLKTNRNWIHQSLIEINFPENRIKLLDYIDKNRIEVYGEYPDNRFLKVSDSKVNIKLAQLEERWMGLNR